MLKKYLLMIGISIIFIGCASGPPAIPSNPETVKAANLINEELIKEYSDDFYNAHGIRAAVRANSIIIAFFQVSSNKPKVLREHTLSVEEFTEIEKNIQIIAYNVFTNSDIDCNKINNVIIYSGLIGLNMKLKNAPLHIPGNEYAKLISQNVQPKDLWAKTKHILPSEDAIILRHSDQRSRLFNLNYGKSVPRSSSSYS